MTMGIADIFEKAADLIEPEGAWTQGWYARDESGKRAMIRGENACSWCIFGALATVAEATVEEVEEHYEPHLRTIIGQFAPKWNDFEDRTQAEVVAKLREAAALARERAA